MSRSIVSMPTHVVVLATLAVVCVVGSAARVHAQGQGPGIIQMEENQLGNAERAKAHFRVGTSLYDAGRFAEAAEEWQKAFDLSQRSELLYNMYVAYRDAANSTDKAIAALHQYLALGTIEPTLRLQLEARLRAMESAHAQTPQNAPTAEPAPVAPTAEIAPTAPTAEVATSATIEPSNGPSRVMPIVLMSTGGVLLVASVVTGLMANGVESDLEDSCPKDLCPPDVDLDGERSQGNTLIAVNAITAATGVLALGGGLVWFLMSGDSERDAPTTAFNLGCGRDGCSGQLKARF